MSKRLRGKRMLLVAAGFVCMAVLAVFLMVMQTELSKNHQKENTKANVDQVEGLVAEAHETADQNTASYDEVYLSKAETMAYMALKDQRFAYTDSWMKTLASEFNVSNVLILNRDGQVLAQAEGTEAEFEKVRFEQLRSVFGTAGYQAFEVDYGGRIRRYYAAKIDGTREVVIEHDPEELHQILEDIDSWKSMLQNVKVGLYGYSFAVSSQDYTVLYHPDETLIGLDALHGGLKVENLEDGYYGWMDFNGQRLYCGVKKLEADNAYVICAVPESELNASRNITVGVVLFAFFTVMILVIAYALLILEDQETGGTMEGKAVYQKIFGRFRYNVILGKKIAMVAVLGLVVVFVAAFYMQTLFSLSQRSLSNQRQLDDVASALERSEQDVETLRTQYNRRYLNKCQVAADLMTANPQLWEIPELEALSNALDVEFIMLFDQNGREIISNSTYINFQISDDPADQSYEFGKLLQGVEYVIQEPMNDDISGKFHQYIGSLMYNEEGRPEGFLQISVYPERLEETLAAESISAVLDGVKASAGGFTFAVEKEGQTFAWYPQERLIGKSALACGIEEGQLRDGYNDFVKINGERYYTASLETAEDFVYIAVPESRMNQSRLLVSLISTGVALLSLLLLFVISTLDREQAEAEPAGKEGKGPMVDADMPDGSRRKTETAASRWANTGIQWDEKTPEQKIGTLLKGLMGFFALVICAAVLWKDQFFDANSIFLYIISGQWERGVNVFSITGCIMIICVISVAVMILRELLRILSRTVGARGETICRMLRSLVKYVCYIGMLYYCFALFGVDTKTLLASAGILSLVIGLGANSLVSDILAGLFIIFEGEFRVGDIVTIGDWRGTVQEIGVRTTKVLDAGQNVKIISNKDVTGIINMTRKHSYTVCDVGIEYGESLERVESILAKELKNIKKRLPAIKDGPFYKGVVSLGDNSVNIRIVAQCAESDRVQLGRDLNREMKILFDKYDINIPFPQVVINQPKEYQEATEWEKRRADAFNTSQKELSKEMVQENEEKNS